MGYLMTIGIGQWISEPSYTQKYDQTYINGFLFFWLIAGYFFLVLRYSFADHNNPRNQVCLFAISHEEILLYSLVTPEVTHESDMLTLPWHKIFGNRIPGNPYSVFRVTVLNENKLGPIISNENKIFVIFECMFLSRIFVSYDFSYFECSSPSLYPWENLENLTTFSNEAIGTIFLKYSKK